MTVARVRWTDSELAQVATQAVQLRINRAGELSKIEAVRKAQEVLPPERRRPLTNTANAARVLQAMQRVEPQVRAAHQTAVKMAIEAEHMQVQAPADPVMAAITAIASELAARVAEIVTSALMAKVHEAIADAGRRRAGEAIAERKQRRVLVARLLPNQAGLLREEFGQLFDLRVLTQDAPLASLCSQAVQSDDVIILTDFIGHADQYAVKAATRGRFHLVAGGMTSVREKLEELYCEQ